MEIIRVHLLDILGTIIREVFPEDGQTGNGGGRAFGIIIFNHDVAYEH